MWPSLTHGPSVLLTIRAQPVLSGPSTQTACKKRGQEHPVLGVLSKSMCAHKHHASTFKRLLWNNVLFTLHIMVIMLQVLSLARSEMPGCPWPWR